MYDMSTPGDASYGQHLSGQEVLDIVRPKAEASGTVELASSGSGISPWTGDLLIKLFPKSSNVSAIDDDGNWIAFLTDVRTANEMLDTEFASFFSEITGKKTLENNAIFSAGAYFAAHRFRSAHCQIQQHQSSRFHHS